MERLLGEILTFYSYKGGVGRSMALANIACLLANRQSNNEKVLMIDWDLEAPGLHQFFHGKFIGTGDVPTDLPIGQLGLIDLFYIILIAFISQMRVTAYVKSVKFIVMTNPTDISRKYIYASINHRDN